MSSRFEQIVTFSVMSVLVTLFACIYLRNREKRVQLWMIGWVAVFLHFTAQVAGSFGLLHGSWLYFFRVAPLQAAGVSFVLSTSGVYASASRRLLYILLVGVPSVLCTALVNAPPGHPWIPPFLVMVSTFTVIVHSFVHYGTKSLYVQALFLTLLPYSVWSAWRSAQWPDAAVLCYLTSYFAAAGALYWRQYRRLTPGVITTTISFLAWGAMFHVSEFLISHHLASPDPHAVWDLPKYFVAIGMILTLFENEAALATRVAKRYQTLFEGNLTGVYVSTIAGRVLECNPAFVKMYGYRAKEEMLADSALSFYIQPEDRRLFLDRLSDEGQVINYESRQRRKDGSFFWILEGATLVIDAYGRKVIEGTVIDITERKQTEIALKESEERFSTIFRHSPVACGIVSIDGVFINVNEALLKMFGLPAEQVVGRTGVELGLWDSQKERDRFYRRLRAEGSIKNMEIEFKDAAGNKHVCLYFGTLVRIGERECIFGMQLDLTEQRKLEAEFLQAQKMEAVGLLAAGVAHDFNNHLGVICSYAELLEVRLEHNETYKQYCGEIIETTQRAGRLTSQLLTFSCKEIARPAPLNPDRAIRELVSFLTRVIREDIEMALDLGANGTVIIDKTHFEQIIINLVVNARDAMPGGGQLCIKTNNKFRAALHSLNGNGADVPQFVSISISDTGIGMDEETQLRAFDPLFTTKPPGRGTGLGLATVYKIVQQGGGDISIKSRPGYGTTISILLPLSAESELPEEAPTITQLARGTGDILLVEDETELRNANAEFLKLLGYTVFCAGSGPEALQFASQKDNIDLVISDVVMPKMNGREFADRLLQVRPNTKLLFISGYADDVVLQAGISTSGAPFLQKPFSLRQLGSKVHEIMSAEMRDVSSN